MIRDALEKAGLDVWLDEEELAGGEAWDAKIREQIRTCVYFMPIISATTEARREGYFRREWRFAVERTLDLADDVLFLVPVVIDDTSELAARVPEKFTTVQWLRCPGGVENEALVELGARLVAWGEEHGFAGAADPGGKPKPYRPTAAPFERPAEEPTGRKKRVKPGKPLRIYVPFPRFPPFPADGRTGHFIYELVIWSGRMIYALWNRLPRWVQVVASVVIVFKVIDLLFNWGGDPDPRSRKAPVEERATPVAPAAPTVGTGTEGKATEGK